MTRHDALFAAIEADPSPIIEMAIDRLILDRGRPTTKSESTLRFGRKGSLWIDRVTGDWHDWENDLGGGSWKLALYVGLTVDDIAALYDLEPNGGLDAARLKELREAADRRQRELATAKAVRRRRRRVEAERLWAEAAVAARDDPAGRYLISRGLNDLTGIGYHPGPVIRMRGGRERKLAPSALFAVTDCQGELCAVHGVQLEAATGRRLSGHRAKISIGNLRDGYVRFGPPADLVCLGEGPETVASVHEVAPAWRCLVACSSIRVVDMDPDLGKAETILLLTDRGMEAKVRETGQTLAETFPKADIVMATPPLETPGEKADMNDVLRMSPALLRQALSPDRLERLTDR
ncbi:MAG: toprim domain-containing protein [Alphaproteobacteria bacterium]